MNEYMNADTATLLAGIEEGIEDAVKAARLRAKICKARNARKLNDALNALPQEAAPVRKAVTVKAEKAAPVRKPRAPKAELVPMTPKAVKAGLRKGTVTDSQARQQAWAYRNARFHEGEKVTYDAALALFGTTRGR